MSVAGVIGFGSAGRRHAGLLRDRGWEIVVSDPDPASTAAAQADGYAAATERDLLEHADIVVIASPNHLHAAQLEAAVAAGRDVLVEKPLAVAPTQELSGSLERAAAAGQIVGVGCNLRFVPAIETARRQLAAGVGGRVIRVNADFGYDLRRWRRDRDWRAAYSSRPDQGGGIILDAIHELDYLYWLFGDVARVACFAGSRTSLGVDVEDVAAVILDFESGVLASVALDYASAVYRRGFEIVGEDGTLSWRWEQPFLLLERDKGRTETSVAGPGGMYARLTDDFLAAVADRRPPRTPGEEGLAVLRIADAARRFASADPAESVAP